jgi:hypothetical protein
MDIRHYSSLIGTIYLIHLWVTSMLIIKNSYYQHSSKLYIVYCSLAGFIAAWTISGLLTIVDFMSQTPPGTFFWSNWYFFGIL